MLYTTIKDVEVSRFGYGTAGYNGVEYNPKSNTLLLYPDNAVKVIRRALELGVTLFDTAPVYKTEELLHKALGTDRERVFVSTKSPHHLGVRMGWNSVIQRSAKMLEDSLRLFGHIDFYFIHSPTIGVYQRADQFGILDEIFKWKEQGKVRFLGVSEDHNDGSHKVIHQALMSDYFDVVMGVPNMTFPYSAARRYGIATIGMRAGLGKARYRG